MTTNLTDAIATACDLKQQMNDHFDLLYRRLAKPYAFDKEARLTVKTANQQYGPALSKIVEATTHADLVERRERLHTTLSKGWVYCSLHPADTDARDAWEARLLEYTVIEDCLSHIGVVNGTLDRIARIEGFVAPLEQRSLV